MINELIYKNNISSNIFDFYISFKKIRRLIIADFDNFFEKLEKEKINNRINQQQNQENEQNSSNADNNSSFQTNKEISTITDNDKEKEIENKSNITSYINNSDKKEVLKYESGFAFLEPEIENKEEERKNILTFPEFIKRSEDILFLNYVKVKILNLILF
jgi:hypothetical protein